ncbi:MAG TPA: STAS domain-containing protein [Streptosporangiaceae bacterium]|nr:STAS domain-containing protein [Streptosporangiaceae bacterium]
MTATNNPPSTPAGKGRGRRNPAGKPAPPLPPPSPSPPRTSPLSIDVEADGSTAVLRLRGELDLAGEEALRGCIRAVLAEHDPHLLLLDLAELTFIDSTGLSVLVWAHRYLARRDRELKLYRPHRQVRRILYITGLDGRLRVTDET